MLLLRRPALLPLSATLLLALTATVATSAAGTAAPLRVASWNLGWHVSYAEVPAWTGQCGKSYEKDAASGIWKVVADGKEGSTIGWNIKEGRAQLEGVDLSVMPPCGVYEGPDRSKIAVTPGAIAGRNQRIAALIGLQIKPDVIAFQEVSGTAAVREALGADAGKYNICSFDGKYKVQRLAFAWRKELGDAVEPCQVVDAISLPQARAIDQVRPGLTLTLKTGGQVLRFLTLHLKSSCVTPLDGRGKLDQDRGPTDPCPVLQQQIAPLEAAFEALPRGADQFIVLGDFNRNLWHEANEVDGAKPLRSDGSTDLAAPLPAGVRTQSLYREINDGEPAASRAALVPIECKLDAPLAALCDRSKTAALRRDEMAPLGAPTALGCRNAIGLDHFVVSAGLQGKVRGAQKVAIGAEGQTLPASAPGGDPMLGVSDHCPIVMTIDQ